ncbi:MAG: cytochrome P460 family protein [Beijerinckiaceae bacterium]
MPDLFTQAFVIEKDSERFPTSGGWGYTLFNYEAASKTAITSCPPLPVTAHSCKVR